MGNPVNIEYFQKINNLFYTQNRKESNLYEMNKHINAVFHNNIDYEVVEVNGKPLELLIIKDTDGNADKKKIKTRPGEKFNLGDLVIWNGQNWLVTVLDPNEKTYCSGYMVICNCCLRWQNDKGELIERWVHIEDYTKYSSGVYNNGTIVISENQYGVFVGADSETKKIVRDMRFPVDFDDIEVPTIYKVTNRKANLANYEHFNRGATIIFVFSASEFNKDTDKQVELKSGKKVWICDYKTSKTPIIPPPPITPPTTYIQGEITGNNKLKINYARTYTVVFKDKDANILENVGFNWEIECSFADKLLLDTITKGKIKIKYTDDTLVEESFILHAVVDGEKKASMTIELVDLL